MQAMFYVPDLFKSIFYGEHRTESCSIPTVKATITLPETASFRNQKLHLSNQSALCKQKHIFSCTLFNGIIKRVHT